MAIVRQRIFFPVWLITIFNIIAVLTGISVIFLCFKTRIKYDANQRVRFSGLKLFLMLIIIAIVAQFGEAVMQIIQGFRYPWLMHVQLYLWYAAIWAAVGVWISLQLTRKWRLNPDSTVYALRALIILFVFLITALLIDIRLALYPAFSLLLFSLAVLLPWPEVKITLTILSPLPIARLMFTEIFNTFPARISTFGGVMLDSWGKTFIYTLSLTVVLIIWYLPFIYSFSYSILAVKHFKSLFIYLRKPLNGYLLFILIVGYGIYLYSLPVYNSIWKPTVLLEAEYNIQKSESKLILKGNDYFKDVTVFSDSLDIVYEGNIHKDELFHEFQANWFDIDGDVLVTYGERDSVHINWQIISQRPWYGLQLEIESDTLDISDIQTDHVYKHKNSRLEFEWYAEPADTVKLDVNFTLPPNTGFIYQIIGTYTEMPIQIKVNSPLADIKYRTKVTFNDTLYWGNQQTNDSNTELVGYFKK